MSLRTWISLCFCFIVGHAFAAPTGSIGPVAAGFTLDGAVKEWVKQPPTLPLIPKGTGARPGQVWIAQSPNGLVIAGRVEGPPPVFAKTPKDMPDGDHVEIWVAIAEKVPLPPIGAHSSMDGATELRTPGDCQEDDACKTWFADQVKQRRLLPRLFVRQWQLAPGVAVETYARPAWEGMRTEARESYQYLAPQRLPETRFIANPPDGYGFEALIPWEALPPSDRLNLDRLRVLVDVFSPGGQGKYGAFSTTSGSRQYGKVDTMNAVALSPPRRWRLTPCGYPLEGKNFWGRIGSQSTEPHDKPKKLPAYFLPTAKEGITTSFTFDNDWIGRFWSPQDISPVIVTTEFFSQKLAAGPTLCGPDLAVRHGNRLSFGKNLEIEPNPAARKVVGGWLVMGAWNGMFRDPAGQCGACEYKYLNLIFIPDAKGLPSSAFHASDMECECCSGHCIDDISLSDDFKTIRVTEGTSFEEAIKTSEFCFNAAKHVYGPCQPKAR
jgi:hypothetical protein